MNTKNLPLELHSMLALSTAHLKPETIELMSTGEIAGALYYPKGIWGFFVYIPSAKDGIEIDPELPQDLRNCMNAARMLGHGWVMFDQDVTAVNELEVFDHDSAHSAPVVAMTEDQIALRNLADGYARHLSVKHKSVFKAKVTSKGKIAVRESRPGSAYLTVSAEFAASMIADSMIAISLEPAEIMA
jgi:hypothetical protein